MVFIATSNATISASVPSMVAQGSILANEVMILAPFAASTSVTCAFILPNGVRTQEQLAEPAQMVGIDGIPPIKDDLGRYYNAWRYTLDGALTEYAGDVTVQFFFRNGSVALASSASTFNVQAGVPVELPDEPSQDIYDQILRALSSLGARIDQTDANVAGLTSFVNSIFVRVESAESKNAQQDVQISELQQYKVSRIFPSDETRVYAADPTGDVSFVLSLIPRAFSIPEYDISGMLETNDPTAPEKVANKRYVDAQDDSNRAYTDNNAVFRVEISIDPQTYVLTATARNAVNNVMSQSSVDLPLESMVVGAEVVTVGGVDKLRLTLQNGNTVDIDVSDIVDGLATNEALNAGLALKVNKDVNRPAGQTVVYSQSDSGNSAIRVSLIPVADALPQYNPGGRLKTTAPSAANDAVNLEYYNSRVQPLESKVSALEPKVEMLEPKVETLENKASTLEEKTEMLETVSIENSEKISRNDKRLVNLENGLVPNPFVTDDSTAYEKEVPAGALPYAALEKIGGMTTIIDFTFRVGTDAEIYTAKGDATFAEFIETDGNTYLYFHLWVEDGITTVGYRGYNLGIPTDTLVLNWARTNGTIIRYYTMNSKVTSVKSVGYNLLSYPYHNTSREIYGITFTDNKDGTITANGTATQNAQFLIISSSQNFKLPAGTYTISGCPAGGGASTYQIWCTNGKDSGDGATVVFNEESNFFMNITIIGGATVENIVFKPMINKGDTVLPYAPYTVIAIPIPEAVQALDGYGDGINDSCYNYIDLEKKQFVKRLGKVVLDGSADEKISYTNGKFVVSNCLPKKANSANGFCDVYEYNGRWWTEVSNNQITTNITGQLGVAIYDNSCASVEDLRAKLSAKPATLFYEFAEPIITDISDILPDDNYIEVEGTGTVTMVNDAQAAVPSSITYQIKEGTA